MLERSNRYINSNCPNGLPSPALLLTAVGCCCLTTDSSVHSTADCFVELETSLHEVVSCTITEKATTYTFTLKTLLRHYAKYVGVDPTVSRREIGTQTPTPILYDLHRRP